MPTRILLALCCLVLSACLGPYGINRWEPVEPPQSAPQRYVAVGPSRRQDLQQRTVGLDRDLPMDKVREVMGPPDEQQGMLCGPRGNQWKCIVWTYDASPGILALYFERAGNDGEDWRLNSWNWL